MSLDEAIKHCEEKSLDNSVDAKCRNEHRQLAQWLAELKTRRGAK